MKQLSIGAKLYIAFSAVLFLMLMIGGISIYRLTDITKDFREVIGTYGKMDKHAKDVNIALLTARRHEKDFIARKEKKYLERMDKTLRGLKGLAEEISAEASMASLVEAEGAGKNILKATGSYKIGFDKVVNLIKAQGDKDSGIRGDLRKRAHELEMSIKQSGREDLMVQYLLMRRHEKDYILRHDKKYVDKSHKVIKNLKTLTQDGQIDGGLATSINASAVAYLGFFEKLADSIISMKSHYPAMRQAAHDIEDAVKKLSKMVHVASSAKETAALAKEANAVKMLCALGGLTLLVGIVLSFFSVRFITKSVKRVAEGLSEGAEQVAAASEQLTMSSQTLSEGASEQAASAEQTSATLEEMTSLSRETAELTKGAEELMSQNLEKSGQSLRALVDLTREMTQIEADSDQIGKIIKTIDEIAFQTNLLALNAAVEAARAGEAGSGFAVVADEVRNLAIRATEAAKNTQELLDGTIDRVAQSASSIKSVNSDFAGIIESATVMGEKTSAITQASKDQADRIDQISKATRGADEATQRIATTAEESSASAEELSAQAETMKEFVASLLVLVQGNAKSNGILPNGVITADHTTDATEFQSFMEGNSPKEKITVAEG